MKVKELDNKEVNVIINIEQGCEIKVFNYIYLEINGLFHMCEKFA
jgi:hypothetical protein